MTSLTSSPPVLLTKSDQFVLWFSRHWILVVSILVGFYALSPFFAPVFMELGLTLPGKAIYWVYSFLCHQLPQRSYFLFGPKISYTITEIRSVWPNSTDMAILRQFVGTPQMGWKVAWSDRMVSMYTSLWVFGMFWNSLKKKIRPLPLWGFILMLIPMIVDGTTHMISDIAGIGYGFRDTNLWLTVLTNNTFPTTFYAGDAWGSFNAWMRLTTGVLFGLGLVWFSYSYINEFIQNSAEAVKYQHQRQILLRDGRNYLADLISTGAPRSSELISDQDFIRDGDGNGKRR